MALKYKIKRVADRGEIRIEAAPSEWATSAEVTVIVKNRRYVGTDEVVPRIERIGWSAGGRKWTLEDARTFFRAGLKMLDAAESELKRAGQGRIDKG